ncbi:MAG TPA: divalent-cation tolerance protein CutA [Kofleriaceae bacterium]|nr:divalent-cation tolerance protein CutA [Kofleriaceae bacterium]
MPAIVVLSMFQSPDQAAVVARKLVEEGLAACVNVLPGARSIYRWKGAVCDDSEALAIIKTTSERQDAVIARLVALHASYELPEAIVLPVAGGHAPYLEWLAAR